MKFVKTLLAGVAALAGVSAASAADLPSRTNAPAPYFATATQAYNWTGFYLGVHGGYAVSAPTVYTVPGFQESWTQKPNGPFGGLQAGFNQQFGSLVVGLEATASIADIKKTEPILGSDVNGTTKITQIYTLAPRVGVAFDRLFLYGKAGYAGAMVKPSVDSSFANFGSGEFHHGWLVGGGTEYAVSDHWTVGLEYNYIRLSDKGHTATADGQSVTINAQPSMHTVRAGVNYRF